MLIPKHCKPLFALKQIIPHLFNNKHFSFFSLNNKPNRYEYAQTKTKRCPNTYTTRLYKKIHFSLTSHKFTQSLIESLEEYKKGSQMLQKGQYPLAIRQFEMALKFLPKQVQNNQNYKAQYEQLVKKLLQAHVMMNKPVQVFMQQYEQYLDNNSKLIKYVQILQQLQKDDISQLQTVQTQNKLWIQLVKAFAHKSQKSCFGKHIDIEKISQSKDLALKYIGLYMFQKIKSRKNKQREHIYLNTCRQLLKQTEQFEPSKIVKPLSLMASNLLAGDQYLQAQGLMSHCLSALQQFHIQNPSYLKTDQEYIMCKLLIARVFEGVKRKAQHDKIVEEYGKLFDQKKFIIQELLQVSYRQL